MILSSLAETQIRHGRREAKRWGETLKPGGGLRETDPAGHFTNLNGTVLNPYKPVTPPPDQFSLSRGRKNIQRNLTQAWF